MRTLLIGAGAILTVGTFVAAERLTSSTAMAAVLDQQAATQTALDSQLRESNARFAKETEALKAAGENARNELATISGALETLEGERDALVEQLALAKADAAATAGELADAEKAKSGVVEQVQAQFASLSEKDEEIRALRTQVEDYAKLAETASQEASQDELLADEIASLTRTLKVREETIASLQDALDAAETAQPETIESVRPETDEALVAELAAAKAEIESMTAAAAEQVEAADARIAELTNALSEREDTLAQLESALSEQEAQPEETVATNVVESEQQEQIDVLSAKLAELNDLISSQTKTISNLRMGFEAEPASSMEMAEACIERANKIFEISQIKFATGTSAISDDSKTTLDHLRDLAIGCESEDMFIEIGGHTDSYGAEEENQVLSEARANSVRDFLIGRGIPSATMVAVGFGETQPIATNETADGRAQNRRITFTWQMRDETPVSEDAPTNADG